MKHRVREPESVRLKGRDGGSDERGSSREDDLSVDPGFSSCVGDGGSVVDLDEEEGRQNRRDEKSTKTEDSRREEPSVGTGRIVLTSRW